jgi:alkanesulfonate monooxygenase SsuD/methylene tetrahydromethanopterin reductase-like flavin-dependent oxidoreductase (luciferase family)
MAIATPPRMGLLLPSHETVLWAGGDVTVLIGMARAAEQAGYDSVWAGNSLLARPRAEPLTLLSAIAAATRVRLGTAVLLPLLRQPLSLAHAVATVDRICRGRMILGVGPGAPVPAPPRSSRPSASPATIRSPPCWATWTGAGGSGAAKTPESSCRPGRTWPAGRRCGSPGRARA